MPGNLPGNFEISSGNIAINKDENRKSSFMKVETPWEHKFKLSRQFEYCS